MIYAIAKDRNGNTIPCENADALKSFLKEHGAGYETKVNLWDELGTGPLIIRIKLKNDAAVEKGRSLVREILSSLKSLANCYFDGSAFTIVFNQVSNFSDGKYFVQRIQQRLKPDLFRYCEFDFSVYEPGATMFAPDSINFSTGYYNVQFDPDKFDNLADFIKEQRGIWDFNGETENVIEKELNQNLPVNVKDIATVSLSDFSKDGMIGKLVQTPTDTIDVSDIVYAVIKKAVLICKGDTAICSSIKCPYYNQSLVTLSSTDPILVSFVRKSNIEQTLILGKAICPQKKVEIKTSSTYSIRRVLVEEPITDLSNIASNTQAKFIYYVGEKGPALGSIEYVGRIYSDENGISLLTDRHRPLIKEKILPNIEKLKYFKRIDFNELSRIVQRKLGIRGKARQRIVKAILLAMLSPQDLSFDGHDIPGVIEILIVGDTGSAKTLIVERLRMALGKIFIVVSADTTTRTGLVYTIERNGPDEFVRLGVLPRCDGGMCIIDEIQNLEKTIRKILRRTRSQKVLSITARRSRVHPARVRLIMLGNTVDGSQLENFSFPPLAFQGIFETPDLGRFDGAFLVSRNDVTSDELMNVLLTEDEVSANFNFDDLKALTNFAWTISKEGVQFGRETVKAVYEASKYLTAKYSDASDKPFVDAKIHHKLARFSAAYAVANFAWDDEKKAIVVTPEHVESMRQFLDETYSDENFVLDKYAEMRRKNRRTEEQYRTLCEQLLHKSGRRSNPEATIFLIALFASTPNPIPRKTLEREVAAGKDLLDNRLDILRQNQLIRMGKEGYKRTEQFMAFFKVWQQTLKDHPDYSGYADLDIKNVA